MSKFCSNCGTQLDDAAKFCAACGTQSATQPGPMPVQSVQQEQPIQPPPAAPVQPVQPEQTVQQPQPAPVQTIPAIPVQQPQAQQPYIPQQQVQQPQYGQPYYAAPAIPKKKKSKLKIILPIVIVALIGIAALVFFVILPGALNTMAERDFYNMVTNDVPTVKYVLGEKRTVTGISTATRSDGVKEQVITYKSQKGENPQQDMLAYATALCDKHGFYAINDNDFSGASGVNFQFGKESKVKGSLLIVQIDYDTGGYTISLRHGEGTINIPGGNSDPTSSPSTSSGPTSSGTNNTNSLTANLFKDIESGTYHMKMRTLTDEAAQDIEIYIKSGMTAMLMNADGTDMRVVYKDKKSYMIMDEYEMVMVYAASEDNEVTGMDDTSNLTFVKQGSGDFHGKTYKYDEYKDKNGGQYFYYMDGSNLKGIRTVVDGTTNDIEILAFDKNVPNSVFNIPSDYTVQDMTGNQ